MKDIHFLELIQVCGGIGKCSFTPKSVLKEFSSCSIFVDNACTIDFGLGGGGNAMVWCGLTPATLKRFAQKPYHNVNLCPPGTNIIIYAFRDTITYNLTQG